MHQWLIPTIRRTGRNSEIWNAGSSWKAAHTAIQGTEGLPDRSAHRQI
jgi:hypothetical protein